MNPAPPHSYEEVVGRAWSENRLLSAMLELTYRCNLDCFFCYNDTTRAGRQLSRAQYFALLDDLAGLGALLLVLSGGEPLASPDFFAVGARARELGFSVRVKSNGHALRSSLARRLKEEVDPFVVELSLHGARAESHDRQTRVPGSFDRLVANLRGLADLGLRLKLNCTLTRWNEDEAGAMLELADRLGVPAGFNPTVSPRDDGNRDPLSIAPSRDGLFRLWELLDARAGKQDVTVSLEGDGYVASAGDEKVCGAGSSSVTVDPYGDVLPCVQFRRPLGNLHEASLREIWASSPALVRVRELAVEAKLRVDELRSDGPVAFCMGMAELTTGNALEVYPDLIEKRTLQAEYADRRRRSLLPVLR